MAINLLGRNEVMELLGLDDTRPRKSLGQNFVVDPNTIRRIVRLAGVAEGDRVIEVGPGLGSLTLGLIEAGAHVTCIEKDPSMVELLRRTLDDRGVVSGVSVVEGDALQISFAELTSRGTSWSLVANLPYNVATQIVLKVLETAPTVSRMLVMVQREVAERMAAEPGSGAYGIPSVLIGLVASARIVGHVGPDVFVPRPRVTSALVELQRDGERPRPLDRSRFVGLVKQGFGQRRKMLRRSLDLDTTVFEAAGIAADSRPEQLSVADWIRLSDTAGVP